MKRYRGDMFDLYFSDYSRQKNADMLVITVNLTKTQPNGGPISSLKYGVMGAGCAKTLSILRPDIQLWWAKQVEKGARPGFYAVPSEEGRWFGFMVVKQNWWEKARLDYIDLSCTKMKDWMDDHPEVKHCIMPFPGIGNGKLSAEEVLPLIEKLDDRFVVCSK